MSLADDAVFFVCYYGIINFFFFVLQSSNLLHCFAFRSIHSSESQQEFFRMLDEKIEKVGSDSPLLGHHILFLCFCKKPTLNDIMEVNPITAANEDTADDIKIP